MREGPDRVRELIAHGRGVRPHRRRRGRALALAREGGHSVARVVHAGGDATGAEIERALVAAVRGHARAEVRERWFALDLLVERRPVPWASCARDPTASSREVRARHTVLATGGAGQCFAVTTNPSLSTGDGIAHGAARRRRRRRRRVHAVPPDRARTTRRCRGRCCRRRCAARARSCATSDGVGVHGRRAPAGRPRAARRRRRRDRPPPASTGGLDHLWLDATAIAELRGALPDDLARVPGGRARPARRLAAGRARRALPVAAASCTDLDGATTLPGLWAVRRGGRAPGVHGANRLASNSLLDGLVFAPRGRRRDRRRQGRARADRCAARRRSTTAGDAPVARAPAAPTGGTTSARRGCSGS